ALRVAADDADLIDVRTVDHPLRRNEHDVVAVADRGHADHQAVAVAGADVAQPLAAAPLLAVAHAATLARRIAVARPLVGRPLPPPRGAARRRPRWRRTASACRSRWRTPSAGSPPGRRPPCRPRRRPPAS